MTNGNLAIGQFGDRGGPDPMAQSPSRQIASTIAEPLSKNTLTGDILETA
jgi:hypothetical protein